MALSSSKQQHPAPTPDKELPTYRKGNKVKISSNCPKTSTLKIINPKIPNTEVPKFARQDDNQYNHITQFLVNHPIYRTLAGVPRAIYANMVFEFWATCKESDESLSGTVLNGSKTISFSAKEVRKCLGLRKGTVNLLSYEKAKRDLLSRIGYRGKLDNKVEKKFMVGIWNYLFAHISECLGMKSGGFDQPNALEIQIVHALFTGRDVDYASLLTRDMLAKASANEKSKCVLYVRIFGLLIEQGLNGDFSGARGHTVVVKKLASKVFQKPSTGQRLSEEMKEYLKPEVQEDDDDHHNDNEGENDDDEDDDHNHHNGDENDEDKDDDHDDNVHENDDDQVNLSSHDTPEIPTHPSTRVTDPFVQQQTMENLNSKAASRLTNWADNVLAKVQKRQDDTRSLLSQSVAYVKSLKQECVSKFDAVIQSLESKLCAFEKDPYTIATKEQPQVDPFTKVVPQTVPEAIDDLLDERNVEYHSPPVKKRRVVHADKTMIAVSESTTNSVSTSDNIPLKVVMEGSRSKLTEMVISVDCHSKEQVDSLNKVLPQTIPKAIDDSLQDLGKKPRKGRKQRKIFTLCESVPAPTPSSTPASPTRLLNSSEDTMPYGRMRGGLEGDMLEAARFELLAPPRQPVDANDPWSIPAPTVPLEVLMKQFPIQ